MSTLTYYGGDITNGSDATPGLWNRRFSVLSQNINEVDANALAQAVTALGSLSTQISSSASTGAVQLSLPDPTEFPGAIIVASGASLNSAATVAGSARFQSDVSLDSTLTVLSAGKFHSTVSIDGAAILQSTLTVQDTSYLSRVVVQGMLNYEDTGTVGGLEFDMGGGERMKFFADSAKSHLVVSGGTFEVKGRPLYVNGSYVYATENSTFEQLVIGGTGINVGGFMFGDSTGDGIRKGGGAYVGGGIVGDSTVNAVGWTGGVGRVDVGPMATSAASNIGTGYAVQIIGNTIWEGGRLIDLNQGYLLNVRAVSTSLTSSTVTLNEIVLGVYASGASIALRSGNTVYLWDTSAVTL